MNKNWKSWAIALLLIITGAALGLATEHALILHHGGFHQRVHGPSTGPASSQAILTTLDNVLKLSPAQHDSIDGVLKRHQTEIDSVWRTIHFKLRGSMDSVHTEIGRVLTPKQTKQFHDWLRTQLRHP
ncbi:MAG TPA: hypothetical protein VM100_12610 [Longimicrobiales bacterium]|nr:hypothetical protein [Longimicrobiales bacterium]